MFSKSICSIKQHLWYLALFWPNEIQKKLSTAYEFLNVKIDTTAEYMFSFIYAFYRYKLCVITVFRLTWMTTKVKWSLHRSFLYGCDRSPGMHVLKLGTEIPNLKQNDWST